MQNSEVKKVPKRILGSLLSSLSAGVVPRCGAPYIAIGREKEVEILLSDLERISEGEGKVRFIVGRYGSGKSFLMQLIRGYAMDKDFLTADADLSPERRLHDSTGGGRATYRELLCNLASKSSPEGGALPKVLAKWITSVRSQLADQGTNEENPNFMFLMEQKIRNDLKDVEFCVGGFDFAKVIIQYYKAYTCGDEETLANCSKWLRGEFANRTEARYALRFSVSTIIDDNNWYDFIKLWAVLARKIGYRGLIIFIDECVNLYKITNRVGRESNYEKILSMFNDTLQGHAEGLGILFGGTPQFMEDPRRGLFSYEALRSRLCDSKYEIAGVMNPANPIIRLWRLGDNEMFALLKRLTDLFCEYHGTTLAITQEDMINFLKESTAGVGREELITPRELIRDYLTVLNLMLVNKELAFSEIVKSASHCPMEDNNQDNSDDHKSGARQITAKDIVF